jgi:hypothetical protein
MRGANVPDAVQRLFSLPPEKPAFSPAWFTPRVGNVIAAAVPALTRR